MSWVDRLGENIEIVSPEGARYKLKWINDDVEVEGRVNIFSIPGMAGARIQEGQIGPLRYKVNLIFDGVNCDLDSAAFFQIILTQRGAYTIYRPVFGKILSVYLLKTKEPRKTVERGGYVLIETEWIDALINNDVYSPRRDQRSSLNAIKSVREDQKDYLVDSLDLSAQEYINRFKIGVDRLRQQIVDGTNDLTSSITAINSVMLETSNSLQELVSASAVSVTGIVAQLERLLTTPVLTTTTIRDRLPIYSALIAESIDSAFADTQIAYADAISYKNASLLMDYALQSMVLSEAAILYGDVDSRSSLSGYIETIQGDYQSILDFIDFRADQVRPTQQRTLLSTQYVPFNTVELSTCVSRTIGYVLRSINTLAIERVVSLPEDQSPVFTVLSYYGDLGSDDENLDSFISLNNIDGDDLFMLKQGAEVKIYVS